MASGVVRQLITQLSFRVDTKKVEGFRKSIDRIKSNLNVLTNAFSGFVRAAAGIATALGAAVISGIAFSKFLYTAENRLQTLARLSGISRDEVDRLRIAFNGMGVSTESLQILLTDLGEGLAQAKLGFGPLQELSIYTGIGLQKLNGEFKTTDELLGEFVDYARDLKGTPSEGIFNKLAFGKLSPEQVTALLSKSSAEIKAAANSSRNLQANVSPQDQANLDEFQKNFSNLQELIKKWGTEITLGVLPFINSAIEKFVQLGSQIRDVRGYFEDLAKSLTRIFDPIVNAAKWLQDSIFPEGSYHRNEWENVKEGVRDTAYKAMNPLQTLNDLSTSAFGVPILKEFPDVNTTVNITLPNAGVGVDHVQMIEDAGDRVFDEIGYKLQRETRQMINNNQLRAY